MTAALLALLLAPQAVDNPRVSVDRWPSNYDAKSWAADVFRIENAKTGEEKTIALYTWVRLLQHWGEQCGDGTRGTSVVECDAIKKINIFPYGECSDFGVTSAALGHAGGLKAMEAHVPGHVELEVVYADLDGVERSHRLDPFWGVTVYDRTGSHIATWEEIKADPEIARRPSKTLLPWGDKTSDRERFVEKGSAKPSLRVRPSSYTMDKSLYPGETYSLRWERDGKVAFYNNHPDPSHRGQQEWGGFQRFQYADGKPEKLDYSHELLRPHVEVGKYGVQVMIGHGRLAFAPPLGRGFEDALHEPPKNVVPGETGLRPAKAGAPAVLVYAVRSPYVIVDAKFAGTFRAGKGDSIRVSIAPADWRQRDYTLDQVLPKSPEWKTVWEGQTTMNLDAPLRGEYQYLVKIEMTAGSDVKTVGVDALSFHHLFQQNQVALPRLLPGKNIVTVTAEKIRPGYRLKVAYRWDDPSGKDREDVTLVDRVPFRYEITAAGEKPADVRTRSVTLEAVPSQETPVVRVMTFNLWHGGDAGKQPLERTVDVIRAARADVVGMQETGGHAVNGVRPDHGKRIADMLGWSYYDQGGRRGIATRFKIVEPTPKRTGVRIEIAPGRRIAVFNVHLAHAPYQPYQLLKIPYAGAPFIATEKEAIEAAKAARGEEVARLLEEVKAALEAKLPVFLTGDFNEPSHLDWTERAAKAGKCPLKVEYPSSRAVAEAGLKDAFRALFPDEAARRGNTWTPTTAQTDPKDRHDRIDFVYFGGRGVTVKSCEIAGEDKVHADLVVSPYPSDHRAVVAAFGIAPQ